MNPIKGAALFQGEVRSVVDTPVDTSVSSNEYDIGTVWINHYSANSVVLVNVKR